MANQQINKRSEAFNKLKKPITDELDDYLAPVVGHPISASNLQNFFNSLLSWIFQKNNNNLLEDKSGKVITVKYNEDSSANTDYSNLAFTTVMPLGGITQYTLNGKNVDIGSGVYVAKYGTTYDKILDGFLFCDGSAIDLNKVGNSKYKPLKKLLIGYYRNVLGNTTIDGITSDYLILPDMQGRVPLGFDSSSPSAPNDLMLGNTSVKNYGKTGNSGGEDSIKLSKNEIPQHTHVSRGASIYMTSQDNFEISSFDYDSRDITYANNQSTDNTNRTTENNSSNEYEHENRMEYMVLNYIIKY